MSLPSMDLAAAGSKVIATKGGGTSAADPAIQLVDYSPGTPLGFQQLDLSDGAAHNLPSVPANAIYVIIEPEGAAVRWRDDGTTPTATIGMGLVSGAYLTYRGDLTKIAFIQQTASAKLNISYYL